jgi:adenosylhomocysteinase
LDNQNKEEVIMSYKIRDISLAERGERSVKWAEMHMPVLMRIRREFSADKPLKGIKIAACMHVTKETAVLMETLQEGGAEIWLSASNPLSTQDDVAAYLVRKGIHVFAWRGETEDEYYSAIKTVLSGHRDITMDDGGDLTVMAARIGINAIGGTEETTTGVIRIKALEREGILRYPVIAVNNAETKWEFDNVHGTGQSALDGILRATNVLIAGKTVVVAGFGHVGRGIAMRARGLGARVVITEVDPIRALKAVMDGFSVMKMIEAAKIGDIFITATGNKDVITEEHIMEMKDGAILANAGHFDVEVSVRDLEKIATSKTDLRENLTEYTLPNGKRVYLIAKGRLVNLVAAEGHPSEVMDMSFADQALAVRYLLSRKLDPGVHELPREIDARVAYLKLESMGISIDSLSDEQKKYLESWMI